MINLSKAFLFLIFLLTFEKSQIQWIDYDNTVGYVENKIINAKKRSFYGLNYGRTNKIPDYIKKLKLIRLILILLLFYAFQIRILIVLEEINW